MTNKLRDELFELFAKHNFNLKLISLFEPDEEDNKLYVSFLAHRKEKECDSQSVEKLD